MCSGWSGSTYTPLLLFSTKRVIKLITLLPKQDKIAVMVHLGCSDVYEVRVARTYPATLSKLTVVEQI